MAARLWALEDDMLCPVCYDLYNDPVVLQCSHSFCRACLDTFWRDKPVRQCPVCRSSASTGLPTSNLVLRNIVEASTRERGGGQEGGEAAAEGSQGRRRSGGSAGVSGGEEATEGQGRRRSGGEEAMGRCRQHGERLLLYCLQEQLPLCVVCQAARRHRGHRLCPLEEAAEDRKEEMRAALIPLKEKLETFQKARNENGKTAEHILKQAIQTKTQIMCEFEELHAFLHGEEETRLSVLDEETEVKMVIMTEKIEHLAGKEASLSDTIRELELGMEASDLDYLQAFNTNKERTKCTLTDPVPVSNALIEVAAHLSNLKFNICRKMMDTVQYTPVTLDPNTAAPWLSLSDDLTSVRFHGDQPHIPDNPERFDQYLCVLGAQVFTSGRHSWDVSVGAKTRWDLGVAQQSASRKTDAKVTPEHGFWALALRDRGEYSACTIPWTRLRPRRTPREVRVCLDYEGGEVSFYDVEDMSLLHSFSCTFTDGLLPYFSPCVRDEGRNTGPLQLCLAQVSVKVTPVSYTATTR